MDKTETVTRAISLSLLLQYQCPDIVGMRQSASLEQLLSDDTELNGQTCDGLLTQFVLGLHACADHLPGENGATAGVVIYRFRVTVQGAGAGRISRS